MNETTCTVIGFVATEVRHRTTPDGTPVASFRLGTTPRIWSRGQWTNGETSFYTVTCFRALARNVLGSLHKKDPVVVHGKLKVSTWESGDRSGTSAEIIARAVGHDLAHGTSAFVWSRSEQGETASLHDIATELARDVESEHTAERSSDTAVEVDDPAHATGTDPQSGGASSDAVWSPGGPSTVESAPSSGGADPRAA
ncbi:MAG TPA: single-stranded DNA-binding protein [Actinopolymorphaceae bacterium]